MYFPYFKTKEKFILRYSLRDLNKNYIPTKTKYYILLVLSYISPRLSQSDLIKIDRNIRSIGSTQHVDDFRTHLAKATIKASLINKSKETNLTYFEEAKKHTRFLHDTINEDTVKKHKGHFYNFYVQLISACLKVEEYNEAKKTLDKVETYKQIFKEYWDVFEYFLGLYFVKVDKLDQAAHIFIEIRDYFYKLPQNNDYKFIIDKTLGDYYNQINDYEQAIRYYRCAKKLELTYEMEERLGHHLKEIEINLNELSMNSKDM